MGFARAISLCFSAGLLFATGCVGPMACGPSGCDARGPLALNSCDGCDGCGELYIDPWINDPADICDPCDRCGNYNGQSCGKCRSVFTGIRSLWGYRCDTGEVGCDQCGEPACGGCGPCSGCDSGCDSCGGFAEPGCGIEDCTGCGACGGISEPACGYEPGCGVEDCTGCNACDGGVVYGTADAFISGAPTPAPEIIYEDESAESLVPPNNSQIFRSRDRLADRHRATRQH